jgi:hypothetical protein
MHQGPGRRAIQERTASMGHYKVLFLHALASVIARILPESLWYGIAFRITYPVSFVSWLVRHRTQKSRRLLLHRASDLGVILDRLGSSGRPFPVPMRIKGLEALADLRRRDYGVLWCVQHLPLFRIGVIALAAHGHTPTAVIARLHDPDEQVRVPGLQTALTTLRVGPYVLVRARTILRNGGSVVVAVDTSSGERYNPNAFHLAARTGAKTMFGFVELQKDGYIEVRFVTPPDPFCARADGPEVNALALNNEVRRITVKLYREE